VVRLRKELPKFKRGKRRYIQREEKSEREERNLSCKEVPSKGEVTIASTKSAHPSLEPEIDVGENQKGEPDW